MIDRSIAPLINPLVLPKIETPERFTLKNGVEGVVGINNDLEVSRIELLFSVGQRHQERALQASYTAALLKKGGKNLSENTIASDLEQFGAHLQVECRYDYFKISFYYLNNLFNDVKHILEEVLLNATFPEDSLKRRLKSGKSSYAVSHKKPGVLAADILNAQFYGAAHPYGKIARAKDYDTLEQEDLIRFRDRVLKTKPFVSIAGNPDMGICIPWLESVFANANFHEDFESGVQNIVGVNNCGEHYQEVTGVNQSAIRMVSTAPGIQDPDRIKFRLMATLFGGYFGSRLMKNIREDKGYTYGVHGLPADYHHGSTFNIITEVGSEFTRKTINEIGNEIKTLCGTKVELEELERVKRYMMGEYLRSIDGSFSQTEFFADLNLLGLDYEMLLDYPNRILEVSVFDIQEMAVKYLDLDKFVIAIAGKQ